DIFTLRLERDDALLVLLQRRLRLGALIDFVEIEDFLDLDKREADALAAQDQLQLGAVAMRVDAVHAVAARRQQTLVFIEAERARRDLELSSQLRNRVGALSFGRHGEVPPVNPAPLTLVSVYGRVKLS